MLDLGAIGKGYASTVPPNCFAKRGVTSAILHGGTSTRSLLGIRRDKLVESGARKFSCVRVPEPIAIPPFLLKDEAMSVSAIWGRSFRVEDSFWGTL